MRPLFTVHAGEFLVGDLLERTHPELNVWVPSRDTGVDLLLTDHHNHKTLSLQVKSSRDYLPTHVAPQFRSDVSGCGWWNFSRRKLETATADYWVLLLIGLRNTKMNCIVITPELLLERLTSIHGSSDTLRTFMWVTDAGRCFETRGLSKQSLLEIAAGEYQDTLRDFGEHLNSWGCLESLAQSIDL